MIQLKIKRQNNLQEVMVEVQITMNSQKMQPDLDTK